MEYAACREAGCVGREAQCEVAGKERDLPSPGWMENRVTRAGGAGRGEAPGIQAGMPGCDVRIQEAVKTVKGLTPAGECRMACGAGQMAVWYFLPQAFFIWAG